MRTSSAVCLVLVVLAAAVVLNGQSASAAMSGVQGGGGDKVVVTGDAKKEKSVAKSTKPPKKPVAQTEVHEKVDIKYVEVDMAALAKKVHAVPLKGKALFKQAAKTVMDRIAAAKKKKSGSAVRFRSTLVSKKSKATLTPQARSEREDNSLVQLNSRTRGIENLKPAGKVMAADEVRIIFLDAGRTGDCVLIQTDSYNVLIDGGVRSRANALHDELVAAGVRTLDLVIMSHAHDDHVGALLYDPATSPLARIPTRDIIHGTATDGHNDWYFGDTGRLNSVLAARTYTTAPTVHFVDHGRKVTVTVPSEQLVFTTYGVPTATTRVSKENDHTIGTLMTHGTTFKAFFTGDAEKPLEDAWMARPWWNAMVPVTLLKASHHGAPSPVGYHDNMVKALAPFVSLVPCGGGRSVDAQNHHGHPSKEAVNGHIKHSLMGTLITGLHGFVIVDHSTSSKEFNVEWETGDMLTDPV